MSIAPWGHLPGNTGRLIKASGGQLLHTKPQSAYYNRDLTEKGLCKIFTTFL